MLNEKTVTLLKKKSLPFHKRHRKATKVRKFQMKRQTKHKQKTRRINKSQINSNTHHSTQKRPSNKKTAGCSQWPAQLSAERSHCPGRKSQRKLRPSCPHPPAWRNCPSNSAHRTPAPRCESRCPAFDAPAVSARAKAPGPPSSYSACTTCNK